MKEPNLQCWKRKSSSREFGVGCMYHFLAVIYYFGIVRLPGKRDYWSNCKWMPAHPICNMSSMSRDRFEVIWRNFHFNVVYNEDDFVSTPEEENEKEEEEELVDLFMERIVHDQEQNETNPGVELPEQEIEKVKLWYDKIKPMVDHVRETSLQLIHVLGSCLSIDEMMIRFSGRSFETHRIKNKPIGEGYKLFALSTSSGYVVNLTPDGRVAAKTDGRQDYSIEKSEFGKIGTMIMYLIESISILKGKQLDRIKKQEQRKRLRSTSNLIVEQCQTNFVIAMDNYFTLPKVIQSLRKLGIGVVGTCRFKRGWPPAGLKNVDDKKANFNDFYWLVDEMENLVARWMDNGMVSVVSTVHNVDAFIERTRRKPRKTLKNKGHVDTIWGKNGKANVKIPTLIEDYNHWMGGVDLSDQRISYYHPDIRCRRNWVPIFIQLLSIIRNNSFLVMKAQFKGTKVTHKEFTLQIIDELMSRAEKYSDQTRTEFFSSPAASSLTEEARTPDYKSTAEETLQSKMIKRKRVTKSLVESKGDNWLSEKFPRRLHPPKSKHIRYIPKGATRSACVYCSIQFARKKEKDPKLEYQKEVKRTRHICSYCQEYLCKNHFDVFHEPDVRRG